jgi:adenine-specific DNA-methyltransferase
MRGAFDTPEPLADFLVSWAIRSPTDKIIDPCCGGGIFLETSARRLLFLGASPSSLGSQLTGVEISPSQAEVSSQRISKSFDAEPTIIPRGFFETLSSLPVESYDAIVGNPPFLRYRHFSERDLALQFLKESGFKPSKMVNAWVPFLVAAIHLLKLGGRLGMVLPAELFQVSYAAEIREHLLNRFGFLFVVAFTQLVFPEVQQEIVLLMGTKGEGAGLRLIEVKDHTDLVHIPQKRIPQVPIHDSREKWTQFFLTDSQRDAMRRALKHESVRKLGEICSVDVGIVTGENKFFVLDDVTSRTLQADDHLVPCVGRTNHLPGLVFTKRDWEQNKERGVPSHLLSISPVKGMSPKLRAYVAQGEIMKIDRQFKCRMRDPWYQVPSVWSPHAFLFRQVGEFPRMVVNQTKAVCTDTMHRVRFENNNDVKAITPAFHNSLTFAFTEVVGRSYGGGVLELMPTEAEQLPVPSVDLGSSFLDEVDSIARSKSWMDVVDLIDQRVLRDELGFADSDIDAFRTSWRELAQRRKQRKKLVLGG